jgi:hypothetical protein
MRKCKIYYAFDFTGEPLASGTLKELSEFFKVTRG